MASIDRFRPSREGYRPPTLPPSGVPAPMAMASSSSATVTASTVPAPANPSVATNSTRIPDTAQRTSKSPATARRRGIPPAVPSPPAHSSRTSPPRPASHQSAASPPSHTHTGAINSTASTLSSPARHLHPHPLQKPTADLPPFANQWFYTEEELVSTPSALDGLSLAKERERRAKGVSFIYQAGIAVQPVSLPQMTLYVASVFFHRFYMRTSMVEERGGIHHYKIAATALFLANKTEENCFKTKNLIIAVAKVAMKNFNHVVDEQSQEYWRWRDCILTYEELMLETLTFDLMVANPYDQLWVQLRKIGQLGCKPVREAAWTFLNDAALTSLPLLLDAADIASSSIFFASVASGEALDDIHGKPWWQHLRADEGRITRAIQIMVAFYTENPLKKQNNRLQGSPVFNLEVTRRPNESSQIDGLGGDSGDRQNGASGGDEHARSRDVTPLELDSHPAPMSQSQNQSQSQSQPHTQSHVAFSRDVSASASSATATAAAIAAASVSGDSDTVLKAVANDLDHHQVQRPPTSRLPNGNAVAPAVIVAAASPDKRKRKSADATEMEVDERNENRNGDGDGDGDGDDDLEEGEYEQERPPSKRPRPSADHDRSRLGASADD